MNISIPHLLICILPSAVKIRLYNKLFGWEIDRSVRLGVSYLHAEKVKISAGAKIGHLNMVKNLQYFEMGENASVGTLNKFGAIKIGSNKHFHNEPDRRQEMIIGKGTAIVSNNYLDCNNTIKIGEFTTIAGFGSAFFTHSINIQNNIQETKPITIGNHCMIGMASVITKGATLPNFSILTANSTLHKSFEDEYMLYSGVPAKAVKKLDKESKYFHRTEAFVK